MCMISPSSRCGEAGNHPARWIKSPRLLQSASMAPLYASPHSAALVRGTAMQRIVSKKFTSACPVIIYGERPVVPFASPIPGVCVCEYVCPRYFPTPRTDDKVNSTIQHTHTHTWPNHHQVGFATVFKTPHEPVQRTFMVKHKMR